MSNPSISIIVPLKNELSTLPLLIKRLNDVLEQLNETCEVVLVDDGSTDGTSTVMKQISLADRRYQSIFLSRNFGHQIAITAGLKYSRGVEGIMIMDGDLQDPPELLHEFLKANNEGFEIIYGIRTERKESLVYRIAYKMYYRIFRSIANIRTPLDSGDFCFLGRRVVDILNRMPEEQRYLRGMRAWVGFSQKGIEYKRDGRYAGMSKYSFWQLLKLAYIGIFNFSEFPVKLITVLGIGATSGGLIYFIFTLIRKFFFGDVPTGFTGLIGAIVIFSGVQLISIGILGEYIVRIFYQVKQRPLYLVKEHIVDGELQLSA